MPRKRADDIDSQYGVRNIPLLPRRTGTTESERETRCRRCAAHKGMHLLKKISDNTYQLWDGKGTINTNITLEELEQHLIGHIHD